MKEEDQKISEMIIAAVGNLSLFKELTADQVKNLLSVCNPRRYKNNDVVCDAGMDSTEMFLLISGELSVATESGVPIATLTPVTTVGEMGIITGQPRTATVRAVKESEAFVINREQFEQLVATDENLGVKVYRNVSYSLCDKIINDNIRIRDYYGQEKNFEKKLSEYHEREKLYKGLLIGRASMSDEEIETAIGKN